MQQQCGGRGGRLGQRADGLAAFTAQHEQLPEDVSQPVEHRTLAIKVDRRKVHLGGLADAGGQRQRVDLFDQTGQGQRHPLAIKTRQRRQRRTLAGQRFADSVQARIGKPR